MIETLEKLCGSSAGTDYFAEILLDIQEFGGSAYMVFVAVLLSQKIRALGGWATEKASSKFASSKEIVVNAVDNAAAAAMEKFGEEAKDAVDSREEPEHTQRDQGGANIWFAYAQFFLLCFALYSYVSEIPSASQASWECRSALFVSAPFANTVSLPMWSDGRCPICVLASPSPHDSQAADPGIPAPTPPLKSNYPTALVFVWFVVALPSFCCW
jgi:hypothetical protein